jgi:hypothetical protein
MKIDWGYSGLARWAEDSIDLIGKRENLRITNPTPTTSIDCLNRDCWDEKMTVLKTADKHRGHPEIKQITVQMFFRWKTQKGRPF